MVNAIVELNGGQGEGVCGRTWSDWANIDNISQFLKIEIAPTMYGFDREEIYTTGRSKAQVSSREVQPCWPSSRTGNQDRLSGKTGRRNSPGTKRVRASLGLL